ncbi:hypothetical protein Syun_001278 [Stephania yunnanensis]|uniref:Uncharacterized protein n=1 Tax=Stephania yunnanensis TaxID=152371 RepID=A0AAP0LDJ7_9MAGN
MIDVIQDLQYWDDWCTARKSKENAFWSVERPDKLGISVWIEDSFASSQFPTAPLISSPATIFGVVHHSWLLSILFSIGEFSGRLLLGEGSRRERGHAESSVRVGEPSSLHFELSPSRPVKEKIGDYTTLHCVDCRNYMNVYVSRDPVPLLKEPLQLVLIQALEVYQC